MIRLRGFFEELQVHHLLDLQEKAIRLVLYYLEYQLVQQLDVGEYPIGVISTREVTIFIH